MSKLLKTPFKIDTHYFKPHTAAAYLIQSPKDHTVSFVETNTSKAIPWLMKGLKDLKKTVDDVAYVIPTHAHADHCFASGSLLQICPNAKVIAHPKTAIHLINPEKLKKGVMAVYGQKMYDEMIGEIVPCPEDRVIVVEDGQMIDIGTKLRFIFTEGHATHHMCVYDEDRNVVFTGDSFGISYNEMFGENKFIFPSTTPIDFDPEEAHKSIDRIAELKPDALYLTHFGAWTDMERGVALMHEGINHHDKVMRSVPKKIIDFNGDESKLTQWAEEEVAKYLFNGISKHTNYFKDNSNSVNTYKSALPPALQKDVELNGSGVIIAAKRRMKKNRL